MTSVTRIGRLSNGILNDVEFGPDWQSKTDLVALALTVPGLIAELNETRQENVVLRAELAKPRANTADPPDPYSFPIVSQIKIARCAAPDHENRVVRLRNLSELASGCRSCDQCGDRKQMVFARGNPSADLCFVGEGPGAVEDAQGEPFIGKAGQQDDITLIVVKV